MLEVFLKKILLSIHIKENKILINLTFFRNSKSVQAKNNHHSVMIFVLYNMIFLPYPKLYCPILHKSPSADLMPWLINLSIKIGCLQMKSNFRAYLAHSWWF